MAGVATQHSGTADVLAAEVRQVSCGSVRVPQVAKATGVADEAMGNVRTVKAFAMEDHEMQ